MHATRRGSRRTAFQNDDRGGHARVVGDGDVRAHDTEFCRENGGAVVEAHDRRASRRTVNLELMPSRSGPSRESFHRGFFRRPPTGEGGGAIATVFEAGAFVFGENAVPQAVAVAIEGGLHALNRSDIDAKTEDHEGMLDRAAAPYHGREGGGARKADSPEWRERTVSAGGRGGECRDERPRADPAPHDRAR